MHFDTRPIGVWVPKLGARHVLCSEVFRECGARLCWMVEIDWLMGLILDPERVRLDGVSLVLC